MAQKCKKYFSVQKTNSIITTQEAILSTFNKPVKFNTIDKYGFGSPWVKKVLEPIADVLKIDLEDNRITNQEGKDLKDAILNEVLGTNWSKLSDVSKNNNEVSRFEGFLSDLYNYSSLAYGSGTQYRKLFWSIERHTTSTPTNYTGYSGNQYLETVHKTFFLRIKSIEINKLEIVLHPRKKALIRLVVSRSSHDDLLKLSKSKKDKPGKFIKKLMKKWMIYPQETFSDLLDGQYVHYAYVPMSKLPEFLVQLYQSGAEKQVNEFLDSSAITIDLNYY